MKLFVVGLPIGNIEDITLRAINVLKSVNLILCEDTREFIKISSKYGISTKTESYHDFNENEKVSKVIDLLKSGKNIALVSDRGTPCISDPGFLLIREYTKFLNYNISGKIVPIPGASAVILSQSICAFEGRFLFWGFSKPKDLKSLSNLPFSIIFFEAPHRIQEFLKNLHDNFGDRKIFIAREITKYFEEFQYYNLKDIKLEQPKGEFTIIVEGNNNQTVNYELMDKIIDLKLDISNKDLVNLLTLVTNENKNLIKEYLNDKM